MRVAMLGGAVEDVMIQRIDLRFGDFGIESEIVIRIE
jgi:hypothetical protein